MDTSKLKIFKSFFTFFPIDFQLYLRKSALKKEESGKSAHQRNNRMPVYSLLPVFSGRYTDNLFEESAENRGNWNPDFFRNFVYPQFIPLKLRHCTLNPHLCKISHGRNTRKLTEYSGKIIGIQVRILPQHFQIQRLIHVFIHICCKIQQTETI